MVDNCQWLQQWYQRQCDGVWEHDHGITVESLDNPGWRVRIDLVGTDLDVRCADQVLREEGRPPGPHNNNLGSSEWMRCELRSKVFSGAGDACALNRIIACFRDWASATAGLVE